MRRALATLALAIALPFALHAYTPAFSHGGYFPAEGSPRAVSSLNVGWDFARVDGFKARVNLPHTLNVVDFQASGGSNYQGPATYEKRFDFAPKGARQFLHFEAIMGKSEIFLNGEKIGTRFGGYHPIHIEVTGKLKPSGNVLRVTCDNADDPDYPPGKPQTQLDFAYFGGIYRDVWLIETGPVAVSAPGPQEGVYLTTKRLAEGKWQVTAKVTLDGQGSVRRLYEGKEVPETFTVEKPAEWTPDSPALHFLRVEALAPDGTLSDAVSVRFGFRDIRLDAKDGLVLNGKPWRKVIGANRHQDFAFVGNAMSNLLHYRDAVKLREAGFTLVRNAHYLQDPAFMDACDEVGLLLIANTPGWQFWNGKPLFGQRVLDDIRALVRRDRSRPCLLLWEPILNETWYPEAAAKQWVQAVKETAPLGPNLCACDAGARGQQSYDVIFKHPDSSASESHTTGPEGDRPTFTREWGDCVDDWASHNSPSRADRAWGLPRHHRPRLPRHLPHHAPQPAPQALRRRPLAQLRPRPRLPPRHLLRRHHDLRPPPQDLLLDVQGPPRQTRPPDPQRPPRPLRLRRQRPHPLLPRRDRHLLQRPRHRARPLRPAPPPDRPLPLHHPGRQRLLLL